MSYYMVTPDYVDPTTGELDVHRFGSWSDVETYIERLSREYGYTGPVDVDGQIILADCSPATPCDTPLDVPCPGHRIGTVQSLEAD